MFITWFILCSLLNDAAKNKVKLNLTKVEVFEPGSLSIHKIKNDYLLSSAIPSEKLQIVDGKGNLRYEYKVEGKGPGELHYHSILAITQTEIYVHSVGAGVLVFDHQLNLLPKTHQVKKLKREFAMARPFGVSQSANSFIIYGHPFLDYHLYTFSIDDALGQGSWEPRKIELKKYHKGQGIKDPEISFIHRNRVFTRRAIIFEDQDEYRVWVHQWHKDEWQIVAELVAPVEELGPWLGNLKGAVNQTFKTDTGYLIEIGGAHPNSKTAFDTTNYYDFFDEAGRFQRRVVKFNHQLLPVSGSAEIFELVRDDDEDILMTIDPDSL